jgi:hypothetical protein
MTLSREVLQRLGVALLTLGFALGCATMRTQVEIKASPEHVWQVLSELEHYPEWNPFFVRAEGALREGESLDVTMKPVGKDAQNFTPKVLDVSPNHSWRWRGRLWLPGLFDGTHQFRIDVVSERCVRFTQEEDFSGLFVPFVGFEPYQQGWEKMNAALKQRAEAKETPKAGSQ